MENNHFISNTLGELDAANRNPIYGYENYPLMTLEDSMEKIIRFVPKLKDYVSTAKRESLREKNRAALKPWFPFLKLFLTALEKLPSTKATIWRGVSGDVDAIFADGQKRIWWSVNSCSKNLSVVERYLGQIGTVFAIDTIYGKDISTYSTFRDEEEIILMPGTRVTPKCQSLNFDNRFFLIHLKEESELECNANQRLEVLCEINPRSSAGPSFVDHFNNWFGSNTTHISNGHSTCANQWIYICFHTEILLLETIRLAIKNQLNLSIDDHWKDVTHYKLFKVVYRTVHKQKRSTALEFLTIISQDRDWLIPNYKIEANRSFIVTRERKIVPQIYGGNLWTDEYGVNHYPQ